MGAIGTSCRAAKVGITSFFLWQNPKEGEYDPDFAEAIKMADLAFVEMVEAEVWKKIRSGSDIWLWRYLQTHCKEKWSLQSDDDMGKFSGQVKLEIVRKTAEDVLRG